MAAGLRHRQDRPGSPASLTSALPRLDDRERAVTSIALLAGAVAGRGLLQGWVGEPASGLAFGVLLAAGAALLRPELGRWRPGPVLVGAVIGIGLLVPGAWLRLSGLPPRGAGFPAETLTAYSAALLLIAPAEEVFLRGVLQPLLRRHAGADTAIVVTALVFAAIHVPAYGLVAIPLDLGVGLLLGWLRERTGSTAACAVAHLVADLGSWWLP